VLFDEFEKAHPDVHNVLLQILDEGRLTDGKGRTVNFRNTIIIMTSNIAGSLIKELEDRGEDPGPAVNEAMRAHFRPEFLNRLDEIIVFRSLGREALARIVDIQLRKLVASLAEREITLEVTEAARDMLAREGYDPDYGARPLKRTIQRRVQDSLASKILDGSLLPGYRIVVDVGEDGGLSFSPGEEARSEGAPVP
jgi:ATP-dependent Clp protease ATP-binding subunit ClpB